MKAALFDLDGVLVDTEGIYSTFWSAKAEEYHIPIPDFANYIKGTTLAQILDNNFPKDTHEKIIKELIEFEDNMPFALFPGVTDFLQALKDRNISCAIVTSSGERKLNGVFAQHPAFKDYFKAIITDAQVQRSKPDPQGYELAAEALGVPACECVVFEDSFNGLLAGKRAGAMVVALATTNPASELKGKADLVIDGFSPEFIREFLN